MKNNKNPPKWVLYRFMNSRQLEIEFPFEHNIIFDNATKIKRYGKKKS